MIHVKFVDFYFIIVECVACYKTAKIKNIALFHCKHFEEHSTLLQLRFSKQQYDLIQ